MQKKKIEPEHPLLLMLNEAGIPITEKSLKILLCNMREANQGKFVIFAVERDNKYYLVDERFKTMNDMMLRVRQYTRSEYHCHYTAGKKK